jgi:hypothetical protein
MMRTFFVKEIDGRSFCFQRVSHAHEVMYYLSVPDGGQIIKFKMRSYPACWKIITGGLPAFVYNNEHALHETIIAAEKPETNVE